MLVNSDTNGEEVETLFVLALFFLVLNMLCTRTIIVERFLFCKIII
ncbi:Uncharacterised protein [Staphylococcus caeli]|uniref:Uncharacterized protein n=1 Tax=Staphylococcus caeli TaxID=2201815 RepID=A0A1D4KEX3_9STAP|nr:Uncharacterised protein [Staphylococcus caeli]SCS76183.1 Uncharacterised protein [Staphylococcus caeli]